MIIKVSKHCSKPQRKVVENSVPRTIKILKPKSSQEQKPELTPQPSLIVRQVRNVRPLTPASALFAWNTLFQNGVA